MSKFLTKKNGLIFLAIVFFLSLYIFLRVRPSQEIMNLRATEKRLELPQPISRSEIDDGKNTDWLGSKHYDRRINLNYDNSSIIRSMVANLPNLGWNLISTSGDELYVYVNKDERACLLVFLKEPPKITLSTDTDNLCQPFYNRQE